MMTEIAPIPSTSAGTKPMQPLARLLRVFPSSTDVSKFTKESHLKDVRLDPAATPSLSWTIGRHPLAEVTVENVNVSRRHAVVKLDVERERWTVSDLKSLNGVHVNGESIGKESEAEISHGDTMSLGPLDDYKWTFVVVGKVARGKKRADADEGGGAKEEDAPVAKRTKIDVQDEQAAGNSRSEREIQNGQEPKESIEEATNEMDKSSNEDVSKTGENDPVQNSGHEVEILEHEEKNDMENKDGSESKAKGTEESKELSSGERLRDRFAAELCCPVCSEVFINPTTLVGCGHVFCSLCIAKWRKKKRSDALFCCPSCRVSIKR